MNKLLHTTAFGALTLTSMYAYAQQDNRPNIIVILEDFYNHFISKQF
ncbi:MULTISPECIES: hypothetical protein [Bacteroides]|nr:MULTISPECIES: hypothetical protein [Bacteroides]